MSSAAELDRTDTVEGRKWEIGETVTRSKPRYYPAPDGSNHRTYQWWPADTPMDNADHTTGRPFSGTPQSSEHGLTVLEPSSARLVLPGVASPGRGATTYRAFANRLPQDGLSRRTRAQRTTDQRWFRCPVILTKLTGPLDNTAPMQSGQRKDRLLVHAQHLVCQSRCVPQDVSTICAIVDQGYVKHDEDLSI